MAEETRRKKLVVEPSEFEVRGFKVEELLSKEFLAKLKAEFPTAQVQHVCVLFSDSKERMLVGHDTKEGKIVSDRIAVAATESKIAARWLEVLKRVLT